MRILPLRVPEIHQRRGRAVAGFVQQLRRRRLVKAPGVAESIDWARALLHLHRDHLDAETVTQTLGCLVKDQNDLRELPPPETVAMLETAAQAEAST